MVYWIKRKYRQIERTLSFLPLIWKGYDWDYGYAIELFKHQLKRTADCLESNNSYALSAKTNAQKLRTAIRLMDKVYDEDYAMEYVDKIEKLYGKGVLDSEFKDTGDESGLYYLKYNYEEWDNSEEIEQIRHKLFNESKEKQKRAHKLLWDFIEHNIQQWWD